MRAAELAKELGGHRAGRGFLCFCPAHKNKNTPALSITDSDDGRILWRCHAGCSQDAVRDALIARALLDQRKGDNVTFTPTPKPRADDTARSTFAQDIWNAAIDPRDTLGQVYIEQQRKLALDDELCMRVLRFHARCPFKDEANRRIFVPALIVAFRPIRDTDDEKPPQAIHRIGLTSSGEKIAKGMMLGPVTGCAIKLDADDDVSHGLGIAEGIETALKVRAKGWRPVWALGSAGPIEALEPIPGIEALTIFCDNDENNAGQKAARVCAARWSAAGCEVTIRTPHGVGNDWADVLS